MLSQRPEPISLTDADIDLIVEALDSHEYWQLSEPGWRHSGTVVLPGEDERARYSDRVPPTVEERDKIAEIERCRSLTDRLRSWCG